MVHHEWGQRGSRNVQKQRLYPVARASLRVSPHRYVSSSCGASWTGEHPFPAVLFNLEVLMLERQGRGVTRPLRWKKQNKCRWAWLHPCVTLLCEISLVAEGQQRKWCRSCPATSFSLKLTRIHRAAWLVSCVLTPPLHLCSCWCWFMIGSLLGNVSQRAKSLLYRVSLVMKPQVVFVLGGPGAGKGTQCSKIVEVTYERWREKGQWKLPALLAVI